jgi:hypothetical protein
VDKLQNLGLVREEGLGEFTTAIDMKFGPMKQFVQIQERTIPRFAFYSVFYGTTLILSIAILFPLLPLPVVCLFTLILLFGLITSAYECISLYGQKPW